jgi:hypothetical protein
MHEQKLRQNFSLEQTEWVGEVINVGQQLPYWEHVHPG